MYRWLIVGLTIVCFPLSVLAGPPILTDDTGTPGSGIAFNIRETGEYLVVRANALENNLILFSFTNGQRSHVMDVEKVPTAPQQWHILKVVIMGNKVEGYVDDRKYLDYALQENVKGRIGLWSKSDSHVLFKTFIVQSK